MRSWPLGWYVQELAFSMGYIHYSPGSTRSLIDGALPWKEAQALPVEIQDKQLWPTLFRLFHPRNATSEKLRTGFKGRKITIAQDDYKGQCAVRFSLRKPRSAWKRLHFEDLC